MARWEIVCLLDADNWFYTDKLAAVAEKFRREPETGVVYNRFDIIDKDGLIRHAAVPRRLIEGDLSALVRIWRAPGSPTSGISVRREILKRIPVPESSFRICADSFFPVILPLVANVGVLNETLHAYRVHDRNGYLGKAEEQRLEIHRVQWNVLQRYATDLGYPLFDAFRTIERARGFQERKENFFRGARFLKAMEGSRGLRAWTFAKLVLATIFPPDGVSFLRRFRQRMSRESGF